MKFSRNKASTLNWLSDFYVECGYGGTFDSSDDVYYVAENEIVVGVVRIALEHGTFVLRGMQVRPSIRGKKIGRKLLDYLEIQMAQYTSPCFCLPHEHLNSFYGEIGFTPTSSVSVPEFLQKRMSQYAESGLKISLLVRNTAL